MKLIKIAAVSLACAQLGLGPGFAAGGTNEVKAPVQRVGVYDSRAVAYAHFNFWMTDYQRKQQELQKSVRAAQEAGDTAQYEKLAKALPDVQFETNRQAFITARQIYSTAPAEEAMAALLARIPEIQKQAGVSALVSKWDGQALKRFQSAEQVDITDLLVREFKPTEQQLKVIEEIKKQKPVPLDQLDDQMRR